MKKKKKTTTTRPSRLGGQSVPAIHESAGILNYFDISKKNKAPEDKEDVIMVLDDSEELTHGKTDSLAEHHESKNIESRVQNHKENINNDENNRIKRIQSEHHENMLLVEEYGGQCCSQDILLGNAGGKVVWNASPRSGFLSTEKTKRFSTSPSPGENGSTGRRKKIEPVILPQESIGDDVDGVLDALSLALANSKRQRRESTDGLVATPRGSVALGALRQCCSALQSKLSSSCKKKKNAPRRSSLSCEVDNSKEINLGPEEKIIGNSAPRDVICWDDDSDDDVDLSNVLVALDNATSKKGAHAADEKNQSCPLIRCDPCTVVSCNPDTKGVVVILRKRDGSRIHAHLTSPWDNGDYRQGDPVNLVNVHEYYIGMEKHCSLGGLENSGFLIHHPEILLGGTRVTSSSECPRRGYLSERMTGEGPAMEAAVKGIMFHQLLQQSLMLNFRRSAQLKSIIEEIVDSMPEQLLDSELSAEDASKWLLASIPSTLRCAQNFIFDVICRFDLILMLRI